MVGVVGVVGIVVGVVFVVIFVGVVVIGVVVFAVGGVLVVVVVVAREYCYHAVKNVRIIIYCYDTETISNINSQVVSHILYTNKMYLLSLCMVGELLPLEHISEGLAILTLDWFAKRTFLHLYTLYTHLKSIQICICLR